MKFLIATAFFSLALTVSQAGWSKQQNGQFKGKLVAQLLPDGRNLKLVEPFAYVDPNGNEWGVPAGIETDGASIPRAFWVAYPPFTGKYRRAAVIHDYYCQNKKRNWRSTHRVFYDAMRSAGVGEITAKMMYGAVFYMGPRWGFGAKTRGPGAEKLATEDAQLDFMKRLESWIKEKNPSPNEITAAMDAGKIPH